MDTTYTPAKTGEFIKQTKPINQNPHLLIYFEIMEGSIRPSLRDSTVEDWKDMEGL